MKRKPRGALDKKRALFVNFINWRIKLSILWFSRVPPVLTLSIFFICSHHLNCYICLQDSIQCAIINQRFTLRERKYSQKWQKNKSNNLPFHINLLFFPRLKTTSNPRQKMKLVGFISLHLHHWYLWTISEYNTQTHHDHQNKFDRPS